MAGRGSAHRAGRAHLPSRQKRLFGSNCSTRESSSASTAGSRETRAHSSFDSPSAARVSSSQFELPRYKGSPAAAVNSTSPSENRSERGSTGSPRACSGDM